MICPQCTKDVPLTEAQFLSMYTCPNCQAVYFIDITGQPEFGDMSLPVPEDASVSEEISPPLDSSAVEPFQMPNADQFNQELNEVSSHSPLESMTEGLNSEINPFELPQESLAVDPISDFNSAAAEITDFANQDHVVSALSYDLIVTGLDTKETTLLFREAVDDTKFGWIAQEIFSKIKNGQCEFKNLNPIQAFVLAQRIQFLDIEMKWKQNVQA